jgi:hypothetical protein
VRSTTFLNALRATGLPIFDPKSGVTTPRIRILDAMELLAPTAVPSAGVQVTPDGVRTLVSKDVNGERWAITANEDGTVTGNVFRTDGGAPQFVWCERLGDNGNPDPSAVQIRYSCSGAGICSSLECPAGQWSEIGDVTLPGSFFLPPGSGREPASRALSRTSSRALRTPPPVCRSRPTASGVSSART